jgi:hypothetical protein
MWYLITYLRIYSSGKCGIPSVILLILDSVVPYNAMACRERVSSFPLHDLPSCKHVVFSFVVYVLTGWIWWFLFYLIYVKYHRVKKFKRYRVCFFKARCPRLKDELKRFPSDIQWSHVRQQQQSMSMASKLKQTNGILRPFKDQDDDKV